MGMTHIDGEEDATRRIVRAVLDGRKVLVCGNGGSASQALHLAGELLGRFRATPAREPIGAYALCADVAVLTCIANDFGFEEVFARQVRGLANEGDVLVCLSTSGRSPNIIAARRAAYSMGVDVVGIVGRGGLGLWPRGDEGNVCGVVVDSDDTAEIQEQTLRVIHRVCGAIDEAVTQ